jgi:hypothetical protein
VGHDRPCRFWPITNTAQQLIPKKIASSTSYNNATASDALFPRRADARRLEFCTTRLLPVVMCLHLRRPSARCWRSDLRRSDRSSSSHAGHGQPISHRQSAILPCKPAGYSLGPTGGIELRQYNLPFDLSYFCN